MEHETSTPTKIKVVDAYLKVYIRLDEHGTPLSADALRRALSQMQAGIRRHVDGYTTSDIVVETKVICVFCGSAPEYATEADVAADAETVLGMPFCCTKAQNAFRANSIKTA